MRIWFFNHYATNQYLNKGGRQFWFAKYLKRGGHTPTVFCASTIHKSDDIIEIDSGRYTEKITDSIPFVFVKSYKTYGRGVSRLLNMLSFYRNLFSVTEQFLEKNDKPDIIVASSVHPLSMVAGIKIARKLKIPCICEVRDLWPEAIFTTKGMNPDSLTGKLLLKGEHWIYKNADAMVHTMGGYPDYVRSKGWSLKQGGDVDLSKAYHINNGVDLEAYKENEKTYVMKDSDLDDDRFKVVFTGSLIPLTDADHILDAVMPVRDKKDMKVLIYGDGEEREKLEHRVSEDEICNTKIKGYVNKQYIPYIQSKASVNLLHQQIGNDVWRWGPSNNKLFEYLAAGKPIISTIDFGEYSIIAKNNCGVELKSEDAQALTDALLKFKNMPEDEYNGYVQNAIETAKEYDFKVLTQKLLQCITKTLDEYSSGEI